MILLGCVSGAALLIPVVGQASAATYPGGGSTFTGSAEGWKVATSPEKSCKALTLLEIACENGGEYDGTTGAPAGSYEVKTKVTLNLLGLFQSDLSAESPTFTAVGSGSGSLALARAFSPGTLLNVVPQFTYTANLVDKTDNTKQKAVSETLEGEAPFAVKSGAVSLTAGHTYAVQIETTTTSTVALALLGEAIAHFDNVSVVGPDAPSNPGSNDGGNGGSGGNGGAGEEGVGGKKTGAGGVSSDQLESLIRSSSLISPATLTGNRLSVKAKCPAKVGATCTISLQGMLTRKKAATGGRKAKVKVAKTKSFALTVKPAAREALKSKGKLLFKETVKAGKAKATVYKSIKLVRK
ncbi:MAG: hypothetical protein JST59_15170 [Actinobacteria bacterium]|nr:hypothetical protein [Actinomycetota bacterium]